MRILIGQLYQKQAILCGLQLIENADEASKFTTKIEHFSIQKRCNKCYKYLV